MFQREDRASDIWVRVVERDANDGDRFAPILSTHLTLFAGGRLELVDLTPVGLSASGWIMSIQLTETGAIDLEVTSLEARSTATMPAASGLWTGQLNRLD